MTNVSSVVIVILGIFFVGLIILQFFGNVQEGAQSGSSKFKVGDKVEANDGSGMYYPGSIAKKNTDGTYEIKFDPKSGVSNGTYKEKDIRKVDAKKTVKKAELPDLPDLPDSSNFQVGDTVQAKWSADGEFYPGTISKKNPNGTYNIDFTDGDQSTNVKETDIRKATELTGSIKTKSTTSKFIKTKMPTPGTKPVIVDTSSESDVKLIKTKMPTDGTKPVIVNTSSESDVVVTDGSPTVLMYSTL